MLAKLKAKVAELKAKVVAFVATHPVKVVGGALLIGFLLGVIAC